MYENLAAAIDYLMSNPVGDVDIKAFEEACGVGVVVLPEQIEVEVEKVLKLHQKELLEKRYGSSFLSTLALTQPTPL